MQNTFAWCPSACLAGTAVGVVAGQKPNRQDRPADLRTQVFKDTERLPVNRLPEQSAVHSLIGPTDARQQLSKTAIPGGVDSKTAAQMFTEADAKRFGLAADFSRRNLSHVQSLFREPPGKTAFAPDPTLRPNRLNLTPQVSSFLPESVTGRSSATPLLKVPENVKQFLLESAAGRFSSTPNLKVPENSKQFVDSD